MINTSRLIRKLSTSLAWRIPYVTSNLSKSNYIYITFDDGPVNVNTLNILKILGKYKVTATFFCIGNNIMKYQDIAESIFKENHSLQNHSMSHSNFGTMDMLKAKKELLSCRYILNCITGEIKSKLFRPPWGLISITNLLLAQRYGEKVILWSKDIDKNEFQINGGDIILLHDDDRDILYKTELVIENALSKGYSFGVLDSKYE